jgi:hypothetical protein
MVKGFGLVDEMSGLVGSESVGILTIGAGELLWEIHSPISTHPPAIPPRPSPFSWPDPGDL